MIATRLLVQKKFCQKSKENSISKFLLQLSSKIMATRSRQGEIEMLIRGLEVEQRNRQNPRLFNVRVFMTTRIDNFCNRLIENFQNINNLTLQQAAEQGGDYLIVHLTRLGTELMNQTHFSIDLWEAICTIYADILIDLINDWFMDPIHIQQLPLVNNGIQRRVRLIYEQMYTEVRVSVNYFSIFYVLLPYSYCTYIYFRNIMIHTLLQREAQAWFRIFNQNHYRHDRHGCQNHQNINI